MSLAEAQPAIGEVPEWTVGDRLMKARQHAGLTQEQMANAISVEMDVTVSKQRISNWETDTNQPRRFIDVVGAWSRITGVDQAWILGFRTGSLSPLVGLTSNPAPELPFPPAGRQLAVVGGL